MLRMKLQAEQTRKPLQMRKDGDHIWIRPGCEIADIYVEWEIYFWHEGLTDNHLTITLGREEIIQLREYLIAIIN